MNYDYCEYTIKQSKTYIDFRYYDVDYVKYKYDILDDILSIIQFARTNDVYMDIDNTGDLIGEYTNRVNTLKSLGIKHVSEKELHRIRKLLKYQ